MSSSVRLQRGLPYRRRLFAARHRKRSPLRRLAKPFVVALLLVGSPVALMAWVLTAPEFSLREVRIDGAMRVDRGWIEGELEMLRGQPLFEVPIELVEGRLAAHPWIRTAQVRKRLPDQLLVEVIERRPVALLRGDGELRFVDAEGVAFAGYDPAIGLSDLLVLSGSSRPADLRAAIRAATVAARLLPESGSTLSEVEFVSERELRLYCAALPFPLVVSVERLEAGLESLRDRLPELEPHFESVRAIDLRFERYIVVQPGKER